jgi:Short C-terminal domain
VSGTAEPASPAPAPARRSRGRSVAVLVVLVLAGVLLLLSSFAIWVNRVALNTDVFSDTSTELIEDDAIRQAVSTRVVDELFESVDVEAELQEQLPPDYQRLAGPAAAGFREAAYRLVDRALQQPRLQRLWEVSVEQSHRTLVAVLEGDEGTVSTTEGVVSLDLESIVLEAADRIGLREQVADNLPPDVGQIEILSSDELDAAQDGFQILKALAWFLPVLTLIAFAIAAWVARDRRRLVRKIGITVVVVAVVGLLAVNVVGNYIVGELVSDTENRTAASNAWDILTQLLKSSFWWMIPIGVLFVVASWLAAPGPRALGARRYLAPALRDRLWPYVALALIAVFLVLTGPVSDVSRYIVVAVLVFLGVVWIEVMRRQATKEFPDASGAVMLDEMRTRMSGWWESTRRPAAPAPASAPPAPVAAPAGADVTARLASLAELHASGALTDEEFASAKARVLSET